MVTADICPKWHVILAQLGRNRKSFGMLDLVTERAVKSRLPYSGFDLLQSMGRVQGVLGTSEGGKFRSLFSSEAH